MLGGAGGGGGSGNLCHSYLTRTQVEGYWEPSGCDSHLKLLPPWLRDNKTNLAAAID